MKCKRPKLALTGIVLVFGALACNLPGAPPGPTPTPTGSPISTTTPTDITRSSSTFPTRQFTPDPDLIPYIIDSDHSVVIYEVGETLLDEDDRYHTAIGRTSSVSGTIYVDLDTPQNSSIGPISVNISTFKSDSAQRDSSIRKYWLESDKYPLATFISTALAGLPTRYQEGSEASFKVTGDLTVRRITEQITFDITINVTDEQISGQAIAHLLMSDFDIEPPSIVGVLRAEELITVKFEFVAIAEKG